MKQVSPKGLFLLEMTLENVRCFQRATIDFRDQGKEINDNRPARWTVILGENGTGKTTVLRSIVGMLPHPTSTVNQKKRNAAFPFDQYGTIWSPNRSNEFASDLEVVFVLANNPFDNLKNNSKRFGWRELSRSPRFFNEDISKYIRHDELLFLDDNETVFVCGYGASRKLVVKENVHETFLHDANWSLLDENSNLNHPAVLFKEIELLAGKNPRFVAVRNKLHDTLLRALPGVSDFKFEYNEDVLGPARVVFHTSDGWVALDDLSLGYKTTIAWIVDFAFKLGIFYKDSPDPLSEPAICLVDEIDLHMHPAWQRTIMKELSANFPNTQFVVTAHSPLIVQAAAEANANIVVLRRNPEGQVEVINDPVDVKHWRVDQILSSDLFGNLPSRLESDQELQEERWNLLGKKTLTKEERLRIEEIESQLPVLDTQDEMDAQKLLKKLAKELKEIQKRERR